MVNLLTVLYSAVLPVRDRLRTEDGLETVEWALLSALVAVAIIAAVGFLGPGLDAAFTALGAGVQAAADAFNAAAN